MEKSYRDGVMRVWSRREVEELGALETKEFNWENSLELALEEDLEEEVFSPWPRDRFENLPNQTQGVAFAGRSTVRQGARLLTIGDVQFVFAQEGWKRQPGS